MLLFGRYELDEPRRLLTLSGSRVPLEPRVFDLLIYLVRNRERAIPQEEILKQVWSGVVVGKSVLPVAIRKLRQALREGGAQDRIETVHGYGFCLRGDADPPRAAAAGSPPEPAAGAPSRGGGTPAITVLLPSALAESARDLSAVTCEELLVQLHQHRVFPVLAPEFVTDRTGRLLDSARGSLVRYALSARTRPTASGFEASARLTDLTTLRVAWSTCLTTSETEPAAAARSLAAQIAGSLWTALMFGRVAVPERPSEDDPWALCVAGWRAYWSETWEGIQESSALFESALRGAEASPWARVGQSLALFTRYYFKRDDPGLLDAAMQAVTAVLDVDPGCVLARSYHAIYLAAAGKRDLAREALEQARRQSPDLAWIASNLADLEVMEEPGRAAEIYPRALRLNPGGELHGRILTGLATARRLVGDLEGSIRAAERAILVRPSVPYAYLQAAAACGALGRKHSGPDLLHRLKEQVPQLAPRLARAHVSLKEALRPGYGEATLPYLHAAGWGELC